MALWEAREATVKIGAVLSTVQGSTTLLTQMSGGTDFSGRCKNVTISGGERDVENIPLLGATSGYANQEIFQKSVGTLREVTMTLIYTDIEVSLMGAGTVATSGAASGYKRIQGDQALTQKAILLSFTDSTNYTNVLMNNCYCTKLNDLKIEADGHAEQEVTFKCLAKDYYEEDNLA